MFGIDKTVLRNWEIESIDFDKLRSNGTKIIIQTEGYATPIVNCKTGEVEQIAYLKITDAFMFNTLQFGVKLTGGKQIVYGFLDLHIDEERGGGNNVKPLKAEEYHELIEKIERYIISEYGVNINLKSAKFEKLELNKTIKLDKSFQEYRHILNLMCLLAPKTYKSRDFKRDNQNKVTGILLSNKSLSCKVYDKTKQVKAVYKIELEGEYMRIEYTLETSKKVDSVLKGNIYELTDEEIEKYLKDSIEKDLIKPLEKHIKKGNKELNKVAKLEKEKDSKKWTRFFLLKAVSMNNEDDVPVVFSKEQIESILEKNISRKDSYKRTMKKLELDFQDYKHLYGNFEKIEEIKTKIFS